MRKVPYDGHPSYHKTIVSIKKKYYRPIMKKEVVYFIARCIEFQKVKAEHPTSNWFDATFAHS